MARIYNATDGPLTIDRAGRQLAARTGDEVDSVDGSPLAGHIAAERIVVVDTSPADDAEESTSDSEQDQTTTRARKGRASTSPQEA